MKDRQFEARVVYTHSDAISFPSSLSVAQRPTRPAVPRLVIRMGKDTPEQSTSYYVCLVPSKSEWEDKIVEDERV